MDFYKETKRTNEQKADGKVTVLAGGEKQEIRKRNERKRNVTENHTKAFRGEKDKKFRRQKNGTRIGTVPTK